RCRPAAGARAHRGAQPVRRALLLDIADVDRPVLQEIGQRLPSLLGPDAIHDLGAFRLEGSGHGPRHTLPVGHAENQKRLPGQVEEAHGAGGAGFAPAAVAAASFSRSATPKLTVSTGRWSAVRTDPLRNMKRPRRSFSLTSMISSSPGFTRFLNLTSLMRASTGV